MTEIYAFDPEMNLHSHFHFNSFSGHAKHRESERKNAERAQNKDQHRESERKNAERARERTQPPTQPMNERKNESSDPATDIDLPHADHTEFSQTITAPNAADPR